MKVKPTGSYGGVEGRIDGVAYGETWSGITGNIWRYPTSRPSAFFTECNDAVRALDLSFYDLTPLEIELWEEWVLELIQREECLLWKALRKGRTIAEATKAGYVNANSWNIVTGNGRATVPLSGDSLPADDVFSIDSIVPFYFSWSRSFFEPIPNPTYVAVWYQYRNSQPVHPVAIQKMKYLGIATAFPNASNDISDLVAPLLATWPNKFVQFGFAVGCRGSCPFVAQQLGTILAIP